MGTKKKKTEKQPKEIGKRQRLDFEHCEAWTHKEALKTILGEGGVQFICLLVAFKGEEFIKALSTHSPGQISRGKIIGTIVSEGDGKPRLVKPPPESAEGEPDTPRADGLNGFNLYDDNSNIVGTLYPDVPPDYDKEAAGKGAVATAKIYIWFLRMLRTGEIKLNTLDPDRYLDRNSFLQWGRRNKAQIEEILKTGGLEIARPELFDKQVGANLTTPGRRGRKSPAIRATIFEEAQRIKEKNKIITDSQLVRHPRLVLHLKPNVLQNEAKNANDKQYKALMGKAPATIARWCNVPQKK